MRPFILLFILILPFLAFSQDNIGIVNKDSLKRHQNYGFFYHEIRFEFERFDQNVNYLKDSSGLYTEPKGCLNGMTFTPEILKVLEEEAIKSKLFMKKYDSLLSAFESRMERLITQQTSQWKEDSAAFCRMYNYDGLLFHNDSHVADTNRVVTKTFIQFLNANQVFIKPE